MTWVGVLPTHRRRGLLSGLMTRQLADVRAEGRPVAALWASEGGIYGRYGYASAAWALNVTLPRGVPLLARAAAGGVEERRPGALQAASTAFAAFGRMLWCPMVF